MTAWLIIGFGIVVLVLLLVTTGSSSSSSSSGSGSGMVEGSLVEGLTVDPSALTAQRQLLQFEGERRYNNFARVQSPLNNINAAEVQAAFQMASPVGTTNTDSLLTLLGTSGRLGAADDGSGKQGAGVEQTGMVQAKINFCESLPINCDMLDDPRAAECGMCHRDGTDSKGRPHRGGLFISSDDQYRANEAAVAAGGKANYQPTIGTCRPTNFTLVNENCTARELQMQCEQNPVLDSVCGQCFGASPANSTGLIYVGPLRTFGATLWLSHPGGHANNGAGTTITYSNGYTINVPPSPNYLLAPTQVPVVVKEGDSLTITVYGIPTIWFAWLSSPDGKRTVSIDIGETSISPTDGMMILGDKRAPKVLQAVAALDAQTNIWPSFQNQIPNSVMIYGRRPDIIPPMIINALYGQQPNGGSTVTALVQAEAGTSHSFTVSPDILNLPPAVAGIPNYLTISFDTGASLITTDGQTVSDSAINNSMQMVFTVPATLIEPIFDDDKIECPTGPLVVTSKGAGLMSSHSCYNADGSFNPSVFCLQELFTSAGGTPSGYGWPGSTSAVAVSIVQNDPQTGKPSLDATMAYLNNQSQIALYGMDLNNASVDFPTMRAASLLMFGYAPANPCDVPEAATGPLSPECLSYLWTGAGCSPAGQLAPVDANGNVNQANVSRAIPYGSSTAVQQQYQEVYNIATQSSDYDLQNEFSLACFNVGTKQNVVQGPSPPEVFQVQAPTGGYQIAQQDAAATCAIFGAQVATMAQLTQANQAGAEWCASGWVSDSSQPYYPITTLANVSGCGSGQSPVLETWMPPGNLANVNCYGVKPVPGTENVYPFNSTSWSFNLLPGQSYASS